MVNWECNRISYIVATVVSIVNVFVLLFGLFSIFASYSVVKWLYFEVALLFSIVGDLYSDKCSNFSAMVLYIVSTLIALDVVFYHFTPLCDGVMVYVDA